MRGHLAQQRNREIGGTDRRAALRADQQFVGVRPAHRELLGARQRDRPQFSRKIGILDDRAAIRRNQCRHSADEQQSNSGVGKGSQPRPNGRGQFALLPGAGRVAVPAGRVAPNAEPNSPTCSRHRTSITAVKFGLFAINYGTCADPETAVSVARYAEAAGFESVWTGAHLVLPDPAPPGSPFPPTLPLLDTIVALTLVATHTTTIRVGSGVIVLPLHNPVVLAKELASVDVISRGRLIAGVAAGYISQEFASTGVPMTERGARTDDYIRALRALWSMDSPRYHGQFVSFEDIQAYPRPVQRPGPPIVVGGEAPAVLRRAVTMAEGWYGFGLDLAETRQLTDALRQKGNEHERPPELGRLELTVTPIEKLDRATVEQYAELGVDRLVLLPQPGAPRSQRHAPVPTDRIMRNIDEVARDLIET